MRVLLSIPFFQPPSIPPISKSFSESSMNFLLSNVFISQYNTLVAETKNLVNTYNEQVKSFNACAGGVK